MSCRNCHHPVGDHSPAGCDYQDPAEPLRRCYCRRFETDLDLPNLYQVADMPEEHLTEIMNWDALGRLTDFCTVLMFAIHPTPMVSLRIRVDMSFHPEVYFQVDWIEQDYHYMCCPGGIRPETPEAWKALKDFIVHRAEEEFIKLEQGAG